MPFEHSRPSDGELTRCTRCIYSTETPGITFDADGMCNYCRMHDELDASHPTGDAGWKHLEEVAAHIKREQRRKEFDVVVGVSGGCDSTYMLWIAKQLGLRVIAVHFDNTWNSTIATENISRALKTLEFPLHTLVVDNEEYDDIQRSFISAGVPDIETPTDVALAATLYKAARKYKTKYILEGHSFRTEGLGPIGWFYIDGKYVASVQRQFGTQKLDTFPNLWLSHFLYWTGVNRIKKLRPLYYIDYDKESVKQMLTKELGWQWYGGHHLENRFTAFTHSYYLPYRFGIETRVLGFAAAARTGHMARDEALRLLEEPFHIEEGLLELVLKRLGYSPDEFATLMSAPLHSYRDYKTYKHTFERMRPILGVMAKYDLVPKSFYMKYTKPDTNRLAWEGRRPPTIEELPLLSGLADEANSL